jgi:hypothetical protein
MVFPPKYRPLMEVQNKTAVAAPEVPEADDVPEEDSLVDLGPSNENSPGDGAKEEVEDDVINSIVEDSISGPSSGSKVINFLLDVFGPLSDNFSITFREKFTTFDKSQ